MIHSLGVIYSKALAYHCIKWPNLIVLLTYFKQVNFVTFSFLRLGCVSGLEGASTQSPLFKPKDLNTPKRGGNVFKPLLKIVVKTTATVIYLQGHIVPTFGTQT